MTIIRDYSDSFKTTDFTAAINEIENQYGLVNNMGLFDALSTSERAIVFDVNKHDITLMPQVSRGSKSHTAGDERKVETFSLPLAYFKHTDELFSQDILGWRAPGATDKETVERASAEKLQDLRYKADQQKEYLKLQAMKGIFKTPDGTVVANMFTEFGVTQQTHDFVLGTGTTDVVTKISELKRKVKAGLKTSSMSGVDVFCDEEAFDRLKSHASIKAIYNSANANNSAWRDETAQYMQWGVLDMFETSGVRFFCYNPTFNLPGGTTEDFLAAQKAIAIPRGARGLYRSYYGPSNKLSAVGQPGQEMFVRTYIDPKDEFVEFELEMAPLHFATQPLSIIDVTM